MAPTVNLPAGQAGAKSDVSTLAILAFHRSSLIGPRGVKGQVEECRDIIELTGTATFNLS